MAEKSKLKSSLAVTQYVFDPDATTATDVAWVDMSEFESLLVSFFRTVGSSDVTLAILGNSKPDGSGTDVTVATKTVSAQPDAEGDYIFLETDAAAVAQAAADAGESGVRYVSASVSVATDTDEGVVTYVRGLGKCQEDLSADTVA